VGGIFLSTNYLRVRTFVEDFRPYLNTRYTFDDASPVIVVNC